MESLNVRPVDINATELKIYILPSLLIFRHFPFFCIMNNHIASRVQLFCISPLESFTEYSGKAFSIIGQRAMSISSANPDITISPVVIVSLSTVIFLVSMADLAVGLWNSKATQQKEPGANRLH